MTEYNEENRIFSLFLKRLLLTALLFFVTVAGLVFVFDPFYHYHAPLFQLRPVLTEKEHQVDGTLKHFSYEALLLGSSHSENFDLSLAEELFHMPFVKAIRSGGNLADLCAYADTAFAHRAPSLVLFNLDAGPLLNPDKNSFSDHDFPLYLMDDNPFNDVRYLLNKDVLLRRIPYMLAQSASASYDADRPYSWYAGKTFGAGITLEHYPRHPRTEPMLDPEEVSDTISGNLALVCELVEAHPETEFVFFFPPVSLLYWDSVYRSGLLEQVLYGEERFLTTLLSYENVHAYDFCTDEALITDLNRYMDFTHYDEKANDAMLREMADPSSPFRLNAPGDVPVHMHSLRTLLDRLYTEVLPALEEEGAFHYSDG
ncbi:MAG: SGNH/GDSL hydrolase family protein [Lachnospiraceae bacterium]|nr:SGNH/GDSL hydrolase family protein [Lachnospiraceae bacterium]